jgi:hypothetical protein
MPRGECVGRLLEMLEGVEGDLTHIEDVIGNLLRDVCEDGGAGYEEMSDDFGGSYYSVRCDGARGVVYTDTDFAYEVDKIEGWVEDPVVELLGMLLGFRTDYSYYLKSLRDIETTIERFLRPVCDAEVEEDKDSTFADPFEIPLRVRCGSSELVVQLEAETCDMVYGVEMVTDR